MIKAEITQAEDSHTSWLVDGYPSKHIREGVRRRT